MRGKYYVYALFRANGQPFYIGKGCKSRMGYHERIIKNGRLLKDGNPHKVNIICQMFAAGWTDIPKVKLVENLTAGEACFYEIVWIKAIGREPDGPLVNMTDGGDGYRNPSPELRARLAIAQRGKKASAETRAKMSAAHRGKDVSAEHRAKLAASLIGRKLSDEHRAKIRDAPGRGAKIAASLTGRKLSEGHRAKISETKRKIISAQRAAGD